MDLSQFHSQYISAKPFPHIVIDDYFERKRMLAIWRMFPRPDVTWWKYDNVLERKYAKNDLRQLHVSFRNLIWEMMSNHFVTQLEKLTGIEGLIVDHTLNGGGLHQIARGGKLDIHADYNYHPITNLDRRVNVLIYANKEWLPSWKGHLELWDKDMKNAIASILPTLGRMVIFNTTDHAYHGHPDALECPEGITRKSIALYYYTNGRPPEERSQPHSTIFKRRPQDQDDYDDIRRQRAIKRIQNYKA